MSGTPLNILYVGALWEGSTALQRMVALMDLGHKVTPINNMYPLILPMGKQLFARLCTKAGFPPDLCEINRRISEQVAANKYDVLWLDKVLNLRAKTLMRVKEIQPHCCCVFYSPDDMMNPNNRSRYYMKLLPMIDLYITTKSYQVDELKSEECKQVVFIGNGFDPYTHKPYILSESEKNRWGADVGFIGGFEGDRYRQMLSLADKGIEVQITGSFWDKVVKSHPKLKISCGDLIGVDYAKAICATKINLCFLRRKNRDLQTTRSVEIPACGAFMLAERTDEHLELFEEGKEAEFFNGAEELADKTKYYLIHNKQREQIAQAGRDRCLKSGYSNHERLKTIINEMAHLCRENKT